MYEAFSVVYDNMVKNQNEIAYYKLKNFLEKQGCEKPEYVIELACGTGNMALMFAENGSNVYATDISGSMIDKAVYKNKYSNCRFEVKDMELVSSKNKADVIYCLLDGMSYLSNDKKIERVIDNVYNLLKYDGYYVFDFLSYDDYKKIYQRLTLEQKYIEIDEKNTIFWTEEYNENTIDVSICVCEKEKNNRFKLYKEKQKQYMFEENDIIEYVKKKFELIQIEKEDIRTTVYCRRKENC